VCVCVRERERERERRATRGQLYSIFFVAFQNDAAHETGVLIFLVANLAGWKS